MTSLVRARLPLCLCLLAAAFIACGHPPSPDAATADASDDLSQSDTTPDDVATDVPPPPTLLGPCTATSDCAPLGRGARCLPGYPNGLCTLPCRSDDDCVPGGACDPSVGFCLPSCRVEAGDRRCDRYGGICFETSFGSQLGACWPSCFASASDAPASYPLCPDTRVCDPWTGGCDGQASGPGGAENGSPCATNNDCKGHCIPQSEGFPGGSCASWARLPDPTEFDGPNVPHGNCPAGSGLQPYYNAPPRVGGLGLCHPLCTCDSDCRTGYFCEHRSPRNDGHLYADGICMTLDYLGGDAGLIACGPDAADVTDAEDVAADVGVDVPRDVSSDPCRACTGSSCSTQEASCTANLFCRSYLDCIARCPSDPSPASCNSGCQAAWPDSTVTAWRTCARSNCSSQCPYQ